MMCRAQHGHYFLSHYSPGQDQIDHAAFDMVQDLRGVLYFATRGGILQFDGKHWDLLPAYGAVYALEIDTKGKIFWAGAHGFGVLKEDIDGSLTAVVLSKPGQHNFYRIMTLSQEVYFLNEEAVFIYNEGTAVASVPFARDQISPTLLFELFGQPYAATDEGEIFSIEKNNFTHVAFGDRNKLPVVFTSRLDDYYLIGTEDSKLFLFQEDESLREIALRDTAYLQASVVVTGSWVNNRLIALGTLRGGVVFVNPMSGQTEEIINYYTGLPDNEIFSLITDKNHNIWVSHDYGFTCIAPFLPFRSFSHYKGLDGTLLCATSFQNQVYTGTSLGLYSLEEEDVYDEMAYYVTVRERVSATGKEAKPAAQRATPNHDVIEEQPEKKRGLFSFLKKNRKKTPVNKAPIKAPADPQKSPAAQTDAQVHYITRHIKKTKKVLRSSQFAYKKVAGMDAKVTHLKEINGQLMAAGLSGAYVVQGQQSQPVLEEPVRYMTGTSDGRLLISTYSNEIKMFRYDSGRWQQGPVLVEMADEVTNIIETPDGKLWLFTADLLYVITLAEDHVKDIKHIDLKNVGYLETAGVVWGNDVLITSKAGFFQVDQQRHRLVHIDSLSAPKTYFASAGNIWYQDIHTWRMLGQGSQHRNVHMLNICQDIRYIASDTRAEDVWVITAGNELYKFYVGKNQNPSIINPYPLHLRAVVQADKKVAFHATVNVEEEAGRLSFEVVQPQYIAAMATEYRFFLNGIDDEWSEWSTNSRIDYPYLPPGHYTLEVQSRNIFDEVQLMAPVTFQVKPPYWKTPWFYALELAFFTVLVVLSLKISGRYRIISRVLSMLTIIMLMEFIQTVAGYTFSTGSSPVIDFLLQVAVAFMVLPVEGLLRNLMLRSTDQRNNFLHAVRVLNRLGKTRK